MCFFMIRSWHTICALEAGGQTCALPICYCRFRESDNRSRTGKQLCHRDDSPDMIGSTPTREANPGVIYANYQGVRAAMFSTGCKAGSLYDDAAFGTPNGLALNYVNGFVFADFTFGGRYFPHAGRPSVADKASIIEPKAVPYGGLMQSSDLREIATVRDPT